MSLNWNWNDKMGEIKIHGYTHNLYRGNALCIAIAEQGNFYNLVWFASDKAHLENMFGLHKGYEENSFTDWGIEEIKLDLKYKETKTIVDTIIRAKGNIKIELYGG